MAKKGHDNHLAYLLLQPVAPFIPVTHSIPGKNLLVLPPLGVASGVKETCTKELGNARAALAELSDLAGSQGNAEVIPVLQGHRKLPRVFPTDEAMTAAGLLIKQVGGLCLEAEELKPVVEDSDRDTNNPLHSTKEEAKQGISRMTNRQELASGQVHRRKELYPVAEVPEMPNCITAAITQVSNEDSKGLSRVPLPKENEKVLKMPAESTSSLKCKKAKRKARRRSRPQQAVKESHILKQMTDWKVHTPDWKESSGSLDAERCVQQDTDSDSSDPHIKVTSFLAPVDNECFPKGLAKEYLLAPLNTLKKYSAQNFDQQVENYFKKL